MTIRSLSGAQARRGAEPTGPGRRPAAEGGVSTISENISEKRGRPSRFDPEWVEVIRALFPEARSERMLRNRLYMQRAVHAVLSDENPDRFAWIFTPDRCRTVILQTLGATNWDDESIRAIAQGICELKMLTTDAVEVIRAIQGSLKAEAAEAASLERS